MSMDLKGNYLECKLDKRTSYLKGTLVQHMTNCQRMYTKSDLP